MSHNNYSLKYRTFDQLFEDATVDMRNYALEGKINPQDLIKVARRCNYMLGFRIYRTRQVLLEVENGKVRLPDDFHILNFAVVCDEVTITEAQPQGTNIEERLVAPDFVCQPATVSTCDVPDPCPVDPCDTVDPCTGTCLTKCGDEYHLVQKINTTTRTYKRMFPLCIVDHERLKSKSDPTIDGGCPNIWMWTEAPNQARIQNGFLKTNFETGTVYVNYMGDMIDDDGNLMVPDHELLNEYYEYAFKERILENLIWNDEPVGEKFQLATAKLRAARNNALSVVNTPNFKEMQKMWQVNRKAQYHNYYNMFKSYWPQSYSKYGYQR